MRDNLLVPVPGQSGGGERSLTGLPALSPAREGAPRPHDNATPHPTPQPLGGQSPQLSNTFDRGWCPHSAREGSCRRVPVRGARSWGPRSPRWPPARPRWVAGPRRAVRPHQDWLLPRDITRLGEKCERERESKPQRRELRAEQGPPLGTPSPPPARGPAACPARWPAGPPSYPAVCQVRGERGGGVW